MQSLWVRLDRSFLGPLFFPFIFQIVLLFLCLLDSRNTSLVELPVCAERRWNVFHGHWRLKDIPLKVLEYVSVPNKHWQKISAISRVSLYGKVVQHLLLSKADFDLQAW